MKPCHWLSLALRSVGLGVVADVEVKVGVKERKIAWVLGDARQIAVKGGQVW